MVTGSTVDAFKEIDRAIESALNVILEGESGVGKDYLARLICQRRNWGGEFLLYDCECTLREQTGIVNELTSTAFFERFRRPIKRDTIFIRRIDLIEGHLLAQLSDFVEELGKRWAFPRNELLRLGLIGSLQIGAHEKLPNSIQLNRFLNALFCLKIRVLPLRERKKEIPALVERFISLFNEEQQRSVLGITHDALGLLLQYNWPDNMCELRREIERAATLTKDCRSIKTSELSEKLTKSISEMGVTS